MAYIMDLMRDKSLAIRTQAAKTLQAISDLGSSQPEWTDRISSLKFETHNQTWLQEIRRMEERSEDDLGSPSHYGSDGSPSSFRWDMAAGLDDRAGDLNWMGSPR